MRLIILMLLMGCGPGEPLNFVQVTEDDARFWRYRAFFERHTGHNTRYIPINYGKTDATASCMPRIVSGKWHDKNIVVNRKEFDSLPLVARRAVIAHELIHCHLEEKGHLPPSPGQFVLMAEKLDWTTIDDDALLEELEHY